MTKLASMLEQLTNKAAAASSQGDKDTSHASASAPQSNTETENTEGSRSSEHEADLKKQQPVGVDGAGVPEEGTTHVGSLGVETNGAEQAGEDDPKNTSGVSEMANTGTTHPSAKAASELIGDALSLIDDQLGGEEGIKAAAAAQEIFDQDPEAYAYGTELAKAAVAQLDEEVQVEYIKRASEYGAIAALIQLAAPGMEKQAVDEAAGKILEAGLTFDKIAMEVPAEVQAGVSDMMGVGAEAAPAPAAAAPAEGGDEAALLAELEEVAAAMGFSSVEELLAFIEQAELSEEQQMAAGSAGAEAAGVAPEEINPAMAADKVAEVAIPTAKLAAFNASAAVVAIELKHANKGDK